MATPFSTPRYPGAPNPTPRSTTKIPRAPIHNPYDKFTQSEFDGWIGDITSALRRALGQEDAPPTASKTQERDSVAAHDEGDEDVMEDSFAEVRARRLAKGKERAREEDFEQEEEEVYYDDDEWSGEEVSSGSEGGSGLAEESDQSVGPKKHNAEVIDLLSDDDEREGEDDEGDEEEEEYGSDEEAVAGPAPVWVEDEEDIEGSDAGSDHPSRQGLREDVQYDEAVETGSEEEDDQDPRSSPGATHDVTEILDSDEEEEQDELDSSDHPAIPARFLRKSNAMSFSHPDPVDAEAIEDERGEPEDAEAEVDEYAGFATAGDVEEGSVDIDDPWRGPKVYAEDFYSGGDLPEGALAGANSHMLEGPEDELVQDGLVNTPELQDPWEGPRMYAEDFYSGGDTFPGPSQGATPSHLTPRDDGELYIPGITPAPSKPTQAEVIDVDDFVVANDEQLTEPPKSNALPEASKEEHVKPSEATEIVDAQTLAEEGGPHAEERGSEKPVPSPHSPILSNNVDWNWPPAFPGRRAIASGHLVDEDDEDEEDAAEEPEVTMYPGPLYPPIPPVPGETAPTGEATITDTPKPVEDSISDAASFPVLPITADSDAADPATSANVDIFTTFDTLYDFGAIEAFEPVIPNIVDFGDLPPSRGEPMVARTTPIAPFMSDPSAEPLGAQISQDMVNEIFDLGSAAEEIVETSTIEKTQAEQPVVVEAEDKTIVPAIDEDVDVTSVPEQDMPASTMEYVVEEAVTEGRLTEGPDLGVAIPREPISILKEVTTVHEEDPHIEIIVSTSVHVHTDASPAPVPAADEFPPPIAADPNVPDPASPVADSVASTPSPPRTIPSAHAAFFPGLKMSSAHTASGLFTPLTEGPSGSATPEQAPMPEQSQAEDDDVGSREVVDKTVEQVEATPNEVSGSVVEDAASEDKVLAPFPTEPSAVEIVDVDTVPGLSEAPPASSPKPSDSAAESTVEQEATSLSDVDEDAEGEVDPEYVPSEADGSSMGAVDTPSVATAQESKEEVDLVLVDEKLDAAPSQDINVSPPTPVTDSSETAANGVPGVPEEPVPTSGDHAEPVPTSDVRDEPSSAPPVSDEPTSEPQLDVEPVLPQKTEVEETPEEVRPLKRKRRASPAGTRPARLTRAQTLESRQAEAATKTTKGKGKDRAQDDTESEGSEDDETASVAPTEASSGGSSAIAQLMLEGSRDTSRASSVVSTLSQQSPTTMRTFVTNGNHLPAPQFLRDGDILRHHHGARPALVVRASAPDLPPPPAKRQLSLQPISPLDTSKPSVEPETPISPVSLSQPAPSTTQSPRRARHIPSSTSLSSPVTRSHCRYNLISLPRSEHGRRLHFAVPGCSLNNKELMGEEEIQDHGHVPGKDIKHLVAHIEGLRLSGHLVGVLRQLVGLDILKNQVVLYLPKPGDGVKRRSGKGPPPTIGDTMGASLTTGVGADDDGGAAAKEAARLAARGPTSVSAVVSAKDAPSASTHLAVRPPHSQASVSTAGHSTSTSASHASRRGNISGATSASFFSGSDLSSPSASEDEEEERPAKRTKGVQPSPAPEAGESSSAAPAAAEGKDDADASTKNDSVSAKTTKPRRVLPRRGRKLGTDAAAYKPDGGESDGSDGEEETASGVKRRKGKKRGLKRARGEEGAEGAAQEGEEKLEKPKRRRVRLIYKAQEENPVAGEGA